MTKKQIIEAMFKQAAFVQDTGIRLIDSGPGWCESSLTIEPKHTQQNGYLHAGVCATIADHTAGGAAVSLTPEGFGVLSIEFKVGLLRPAVGQTLRCRATVLRAGKTISFVEAEVFCKSNDGEKLVSKASVTLAVVPWAPAPVAGSQ
jgi:uncharacterized protein (TIGR00369 family)